MAALTDGVILLQTFTADCRMADQSRLEALYRRLTDERRRLVQAAADADMLPPAGLLSHLSQLDSAIVAVEAVMEESTSLQASVIMAVGAVNGVTEVLA